MRLLSRCTESFGHTALKLGAVSSSFLLILEYAKDIASGSIGGFMRVSNSNFGLRSSFKTTSPISVAREDATFEVPSKSRTAMLVNGLLHPS